MAMLKVLLDGKLEQFEFYRIHDGQHEYHLMKEGKPIASHSIPTTLEGDRAFRVNGHSYRTDIFIDAY
jgi:hypothetical protein